MNASRNAAVTAPDAFVRRALLSPDPLWQAQAGDDSRGGWSTDEFAQAVEAAAQLRSQIGARVWGEVGAVDGPEFPYVLFRVEEDARGAVTMRGRRDVQLRREARVLVRRFDFFTSGRGSYAPGAQSYDVIRALLCGVPETPVNVPVEGTETVIGWVRGTFWDEDYRATYRDPKSGARVTEVGFWMSVVYDHNN